jgi:hypothetical protein
MDTSELISSLIQSVVERFVGWAWPIAVIILAHLFRSQLRELIGRIRRGRFPGGEVEFEPGVTLTLFEARRSQQRRISLRLPALLPPTPSSARPPDHSTVGDR